MISRNCSFIKIMVHVFVLVNLRKSYFSFLYDFFFVNYYNIFGEIAIIVLESLYSIIIVFL